MFEDLRTLASQRVLPFVTTGAALLLGWSVLLLVSKAAIAAESDAQANAVAAKIATQLCSNCHGPAGNSVSPTFPKLGGQQEAYLAAQLKAFKSKSRGDPEAHDYMWGMATLLEDSTIEGLARYYAAQPPAPGIPGDAKLIGEGRRLYEEGVPSRNIAACASCHGKDAEGAAIFPRLAGQHAAYLARQLQVIQTQLRASPIMHGIIKDLKPEEMKAVAAFLQSK